MIMAKRNPWRVNFTDRRARFVNLWNNVRRDFPPTIYVTLEFFSYISRKPQDLPGTSHTRRESWSFPFHTNKWNAFSTTSWKSQDFPETSHKREIWSVFLKIWDTWKAVYYPHYIDWPFVFLSLWKHLRKS